MPGRRWGVLWLFFSLNFTYGNFRKINVLRLILTSSLRKIIQFIFQEFTGSKFIKRRVLNSKKTKIKKPMKLHIIVKSCLKKLERKIKTKKRTKMNEKVLYD